MAWTEHDYEKIPGTYVFNGRRSLMGYSLNKMCMSFNSGDNRDEFSRDEAAYCNKFGLSDEQRDAVLKRDILKLLQLGGNIYYLAKLAGITHLSVQDVGAQMSGVTVEEFKAKLLAAAED
ncbi:MAG: protocatechuate 4,5-dioxygenase subunit alpha [Rhodospirillales bacterium]|nr:protocatechuate 4,5-dioxygenase subunit alpha [Rhodospirillales bacterium]